MGQYKGYNDRCFNVDNKDISNKVKTKVIKMMMENVALMNIKYFIPFAVVK